MLLRTHHAFFSKFLLICTSQLQKFKTDFCSSLGCSLKFAVILNIKIIFAKNKFQTMYSYLWEFFKFLFIESPFVIYIYIYIYICVCVCVCVCVCMYKCVYVCGKAAVFYLSWFDQMINFNESFQVLWF